MKRFYTLVSTKKTPAGFEIALDGRSVKTPAGAFLCAPNEALAEAIVLEWAGQEGEIKPDTMPLTQILHTQQDQVRVQRPAMTSALLKFLDTDLLCYRCGPQPEGLADRQAALWDPCLDWFGKRFGTPLQTTTRLSALKHPEAVHKAVAAFIAGLDAARFTLLQILTPLSGSLVLGLAFVEGMISAEAVFSVMRVEEHFKAELYNEAFYGPDPAQEKKDQAIRRDLAAAELFLKAIR